MTDKPVQKEAILRRDVGEDTMLYDTEGRAIHVLSETALFIWERCDGEHDTDAIVQEAVDRYEASPEEVRPDVESTLAQFRELGILKPAP